MRGLLHYYFDGVMPFLQVSLGSHTVCSLSPAACCVSFHLCHLGRGGQQTLGLVGEGRVSMQLSLCLGSFNQLSGAGSALLTF